MMKKSELKKLIKPIVKECIAEMLLEEGMLSSLISEVLQGTGATVTESRTPAPKVVDERMKAQEQEVKKQMRDQIEETRRKLSDSLGKEAFGGVNVFEGLEPIAAGPAPSSAGTGARGPMSGIAPNDPGVDISALTGIMGNTWKKLADNKE
jgi:hypothetical protein